MFENIINPVPVTKIEKAFTDANALPKGYDDSNYDAVEFAFENGVMVRKDPMLGRLSGPTPQDAKREPEHPAQTFSTGARIVDREVQAGDDSVTPRPRPYQYTEPTESDLTSSGTLRPNFIPTGMVEDMSREMFSVPGEKNRIAVDDADPGDLDDVTDPFAVNDDDDDDDVRNKSIRLGFSRALKSEFPSDGR